MEKKKEIRRFFGSVGRWMLIFYGLMAALYWSYQHYFFFRPAIIPPTQPLQIRGNFIADTQLLPLDKETAISWIKLRPPGQAPKGVVLYFHGNRGNVERYAKFAESFTRNGMECWMPDYPQFGKSSGQLNLENLDFMAEQLYKMALKQFRPDQIVIYGRSLGSGIAAGLAKKAVAAALILETPYNHIWKVSGSYLFLWPLQLLTRFPLSTLDPLEMVEEPITVLHGSNDEVIPLPLSFELQTKLKPNDKFILIKGGGHNNLSSFSAYNHSIDSIMKSIAK